MQEGAFWCVNFNSANHKRWFLSCPGQTRGNLIKASKQMKGKQSWKKTKYRPSKTSVVSFPEMRSGRYCSSRIVIRSYQCRLTDIGIMTLGADSILNHYLMWLTNQPQGIMSCAVFHGGGNAGTFWDAVLTCSRRSWSMYSAMSIVRHNSMVKRSFSYD